MPLQHPLRHAARPREGQYAFKVPRAPGRPFVLLRFVVILDQQPEKIRRWQLLVVADDNNMPGACNRTEGIFWRDLARLINNHKSNSMRPGGKNCATDKGLIRKTGFIF